MYAMHGAFMLLICMSLQPIAQGLGLNTQVHKLWKDRAIIELNVAILHSFQVSQHSRE